MLTVGGSLTSMRGSVLGESDTLTESAVDSSPLNPS